MKNQKINNLLTHFEGAISPFFQKLPEIFVLLAIPTFLFAYIFLKPQLAQNQKSPKIDNPNVTINEENGENIDERLRTLMTDAQRDLLGGTEPAKLKNYSTKSAEISLKIPKLDLIGPWSCETSKASGLITKLYIYNKSVKLTAQTEKGTEHMLLKDECLYSWRNNGDGKKQCNGISDMLTIAEFASQSGLFDITSLIDQIGGESANDLKSLVASCNKTPISSVIFNIPQGIKWTEDNFLINSPN